MKQSLSVEKNVNEVLFNGIYIPFIVIKTTITSFL